MILAIDIGNTNIVIGCAEGEKIIFTERVSTCASNTELEYVVELKALFDLYEIRKEEIAGAIISSVVPPVTAVIGAAVEKYCGVKPLLVGPGVKTGMNILMDNPASVGADLIVNAVAGMKYYGAPLVMIDMGTATTLSVLDPKGCYIGGMIIPGVRVSLDSLVSRTSQLPRISLDAPKKILGKNTVDCMKSGIVIGQAAQMDGLIDRTFEELGYDAPIVATGGLSSKIIPNCRHDIIIDNELTLKGLAIIYAKNRENV